MSNWIVVESRVQLRLARAWLARQREPYEFVATTPAPLYALQREGVPVVGLDEFASGDELNAIAVYNLDDSSRACRLLGDAWRSGAQPEAERYDPFVAAWYPLKRAADSASFRLRELLNFHAAVAPARVAFVDGPYRQAPVSDVVRPHDTGPLFFEPSESMTGLLSRSGAWPEPTIVERIPYVPPRVQGRARDRWKGLAGRLLNRNRVQALRFGRRAGGLFSRRGGTQRMLAVGPDPSVRAFATYAWRECGVGLDWWVHLDQAPVALPTFRGVSLRPRREPSIETGPLIEAIEQLEREGLWLVDGNRAAQRLMEDRLRYFVAHRLRYLVGLDARIDRYLEARRPIAVLSGEASSDTSQTMSLAAARHGLPFVVFQHGGCYGYCDLPMLYHSDLKAADLFVSWGADVSSDLSQGLGPAPRVRFVDAGWPGSASRDDTAAMDDGPLRTVLYVPTGLHGNQRYGPYHSPTDIRYFNHQREVVDALRRILGVQVVVKLHYKSHVPDPLRQHVVDAGYDNVTVLEQGPMTDLLPSAHVVVIDYASTTLLEGMAAGKPVVVLDLGVHRFSTEGLRALRKAAQWVEMGEGWQQHLQAAVAAALAEGRLPGAGEFLARYADGAYRPEPVWQAIEDWVAHRADRLVERR